MNEFSKISLHNHFQRKKNEVTIEKSINGKHDLDLEYATNVLKDAHDNGFNLLGYTPANVFSIKDYLMIRSLARRLGINMIPGVEINLLNEENGKYMHVVVLFDDDSNLLEIESKITKGIEINKKAFLTLNQFIDLSLKSRCIIIPHAIKQSGGDHSGCKNYNLISEILSSSKAIPILLDGSKKFHKKVLLARLNDKLSEYENDQLEQIEIISSADRTSFSNIEDPTYMWGGNTFSSLYFCSIIGKKRFVRNSDKTDKEKFIDYIKISPNINGELVKNDRLELSHGLNSVVGLSGSGKTLLLNFIFNKIKSEDMKNLTTSKPNYSEIYDNVTLNLVDNNGKEVSSEDLIVLEGDNLYNTLTMNYHEEREKMFEKFEIGVNTDTYEDSLKIFNHDCNQYIKNRIEIKKLRKEVNGLIKNTIANQKSVDLNKQNTRFTVKYVYDSKKIEQQEKVNSKVKEVKNDIEKLRKIYSNITEIGTKYNATQVTKRLQLELIKLSNVIKLFEVEYKISNLELRKTTDKVKYIEPLVREYNRNKQ